MLPALPPGSDWCRWKWWLPGMAMPMRGSCSPVLRAVCSPIHPASNPAIPHLQVYYPVPNEVYRDEWDDVQASKHGQTMQQ